MQPSPNRLNCNGGQPDPLCIQGVSENFCEKKSIGIYEHPTFCDKLIYCVPGGQQVQPCPLGTGYNPYIRNCDSAGFLRCASINLGKMN